MRNLFVIIICSLFLGIQAQAEPELCDDSMIGTFTAANPDGNLWNEWRIEIRKENKKSGLFGYEFLAEVNISCGTKVRSALYRINCDSMGASLLQLIRGGSGQCSLGDHPHFYGAYENISISTGIRTPNFDGDYELQRVQPNPIP